MIRQMPTSFLQMMANIAGQTTKQKNTRDDQMPQLLTTYRTQVTMKNSWTGCGCGREKEAPQEEQGMKKSYKQETAGSVYSVKLLPQNLCEPVAQPEHGKTSVSLEKTIKTGQHRCVHKFWSHGPDWVCARIWVDQTVT